MAALAAGDAHSAALTANGFLFTWGSNDRGQLGLPAVAEVAAQVCRPKDTAFASAEQTCGCLRTPGLAAPTAGPDFCAARCPQRVGHAHADTQHNIKDCCAVKLLRSVDDGLVLLAQAQRPHR